jgi:uncharacterized membrane protein YadS
MARIALTLPNPYQLSTARVTSPLLRISVTGLGAGMNLAEVGWAGVQGFFYTVIGITLTMIVGLTLDSGTLGAILLGWMG